MENFLKINTESHTPYTASEIASPPKMPTPQAMSFEELMSYEGAKAVVSFSYPKINQKGDVEVATSHGVHFNHHYPWNWIMGSPGGSSIQVTTHFNAQEIKQPWYLNVKELSSIVGGYGQSPIQVQVNGHVIADQFKPAVDLWRMDHFEIPAEYLQEGSNTISIHLCSNAFTNYWIENLTLTDRPIDTWILHYPF